MKEEKEMDGQVTATQVDIFIAAIATIIAVIQFSNEIRKTMDVRKKKKLFESFANQSTIIDGFIRKFNGFFAKIDDFNTNSASGEEVVKAVIDGVESLQSSAKDFYPIMEDLYTAFLQNESEFSMSYGYDRYINHIRVFLDHFKKADDKMIGCHNVLLNYVKNVQAQIVDLDSVTLKKNLDANIAAVNELRQSVNNICPILNEIMLKYKKGSSGVMVGK